jgi:glutamate-ammonia-ligase adenylyltransferase
MEPSYVETFPEEDIARHAKLLERLSHENLVEIEARPLGQGKLWQVTLAGFDLPGDLSMICGLLFVYGFNIVSGNAFTEESFAGSTHSRVPGRSGNKSRRRFVNVFQVRPPLDVVLPEVWQRYREDLVELLALIADGEERKAQGHLAKRMAAGLREATNPPSALFPVDIELDNEISEHYTVLHIRGTDTIGFLYELSNALTLAEIDVARVIVSSVGESVFDTLYVTNRNKQKITDPNRLKELRAAVVLIKHFTHLLPGSPNPETALLQFRELLEELFKRETWYEELSSLNRFDVLDALARLLGVSTFLWEDFLRLQHENLFPVVTDTEALAHRKPKTDLEAELTALLEMAEDFEARTAELNAFKDREMFRTDMRHIMGCITGFGEFSEELADVADTVVAGATEICSQELQHRFGIPRFESGEIAPLSICALGKHGGRELGYASDIELMFIYEDVGHTDGAESITVSEYYQKFVELFRQTIKARQEGIFQVDLRLRPYGRAGSLAVSLEAFQHYFGPEGAAWPYERQALVKLRPVAGDKAFGKRIVGLRDSILYSGEPFDVVAMRGMREKQVLQLVKAETINAKLSPGGLVDCEYLVQGLQITHGHRDPRLRTTNTLEALDVLAELGFIPDVDHDELRESYIFLRRLIDALRMVRGHAKDLTVPPPDSEAFEFLARRLGHGNDSARVQRNLNRSTECIQELTRLLDAPTT